VERRTGEQEKRKLCCVEWPTAVSCSTVLLLLFDLVMAFMFENLQVYQKAVDFSDRIASQTEKFPRGYYFLVDQLNRAALSIATDLAEGDGRFTKPDRKNFFTIARGSVQECVPLIEVARRRRFIADADHSTLKSHLEEMAKMISGLINGLNQREV
jgi:four helix bundle protein